MAWPWLLGVGALALALRLAVIAACQDSPLFSDMNSYHYTAMHLLAEGRLPANAFVLPGYPIALAGLYAIFGERLVVVRVVQAVLGTVVVLLTYCLARRILAPRPAIGAALVVAVYQPGCSTQAT